VPTTEEKRREKGGGGARQCRGLSHAYRETPARICGRGKKGKEKEEEGEQDIAVMAAWAEGTSFFKAGIPARERRRGRGRLAKRGCPSWNPQSPALPQSAPSKEKGKRDEEGKGRECGLARFLPYLLSSSSSLTKGKKGEGGKKCKSARSPEGRFIPGLRLFTAPTRTMRKAGEEKKGGKKKGPGSDHNSSGKCLLESRLARKGGKGNMN